MWSLRAGGWSRIANLWRRIGPRARDIAFIGIALMATAAEALAGRHGGRAAWFAAVLIGLVGTTSLWWRRRYPVLVTAVGLVGLAVTAVPVTACIGLFTLAIRRRDTVLALMTVLTAAVFATVSTTTTAGSIAGNIISGALVGGFSCAAGAYVGARRDLVASLRERAERAEGEREQRANQARAEERTRIAREMHDVLAHKVSLIALHAGALEVNRGVDERVQRTAALIGATAHEAMEDLREVLGVLRTGADHDGTELAPQPGVADIERVVGDSVAAGVRTDLTIDLHADDVPESIGRAAYRVVREGLTNAHKHARGAATSVVVTGDVANGVRVEVVNCASVFATTLLPGSGAGLPGLRERVALLGGTLDAGPTEAGGWRLVGVVAVDVTMIRVLIVDDELLVRAGLRMILESADDITVVGEAVDGDEAAEAARRCAPDVVLMDIRMPRLDGLAATLAIQELEDPPAVVILTTFALDDYVFRALQAGATGFLLKDTPPLELIAAVRVVAAGESMLSPSVTRRLIAHVAAESRDNRRNDALRRLEPLSPREREVFTEVGRGLSNAEIGAALFMSEATVKAHVSRLLLKLDLTNRVQVAILAHDAGIAE